MANEVTKKGPGGRPTKYNKATAEIFVDLIKMGKTIAEICSLDSMPCESTFYLWKSTHQEFSDKCEEAEQYSADAIYGRAVNMALTLPEGKRYEGANGEVFSEEEYRTMLPQERAELGILEVGLSSPLVAARKLKYDALKNWAAIRNPDKYSERRNVQMNLNVKQKEFLDGLDDES